jgi:hypothetical protein
MTREPFRPIVIDLPVKFIALLDKTAQDLGTTRHKLINKMLKRDYDYIIRFEAPPNPKFEEELDARLRGWHFDTCPAYKTA